MLVGALAVDGRVGVAVDDGGRHEDVSAAGLEVEVVTGQAAAGLCGAGVVQVQAAGGGGHGVGVPVEQSGLCQGPDGGVARSAGAAVDVEDVDAARAGGQGQVRGGGAPPPVPDEVGVGAGIEHPVRGQGPLVAGHAREHRPPGAGQPQGLGEQGLRVRCHRAGPWREAAGGVGVGGHGAAPAAVSRAWSTGTGCGSRR